MRRTLAGLGLLAGVACASPLPEGLGVHDGRLAPCPDSPNCVSTDADGDHATGPFRLAKPAPDAWQDAREALQDLPRTVVVEEGEDYLRAESTSPILGFVDDLELHLRPESGEIAVRSASRTGYSDMGVNRERVWELRRALEARGAIR